VALRAARPATAGRLAAPRGLARALAAAALLAGAPPIGAQQPSPAPRPSPVPTSTPADTVPGRAVADTLRDSVLARLQRAEEAIALLRQQLAAQAASATQSQSRARFDIGGRVLVNGFLNSRGVNNVDVPQFVRPDAAAGPRAGGIGGALRQTTLSGTAFVPRVLGADFTGDVNIDFYGGQQASPGGRHFPLVRMRTARAALRWRDYEIMAGQDGPLVAPVEPVSLAAVGVAEFGTAGNLWIWLPQVRVSADRALTRGSGPRGDGALRVGVQAALLAPNNGDAVGLFDTGVDAAERSKRPFVQGRLRARWGEEDRAGELAVGYHRGWIVDPTGPPVGYLKSEATVASALLPLGGAGPVRFDLRGEAFRGQALRGLGGGGIAQTFAVAGANTPAQGTTPAVRRGSIPLETRGGWAQANVRYLELVTVGAGCGVDAPRGTLNPAAAPRQRNNVCEGHAILRPEGPLLLGLTYRRTRTRYAAVRSSTTTTTSRWASSSSPRADVCRGRRPRARRDRRPWLGCASRGGRPGQRCSARTERRGGGGRAPRARPRRWADRGDSGARRDTHHRRGARASARARARRAAPASRRPACRLPGRARAGGALPRLRTGGQSRERACGCTCATRGAGSRPGSSRASSPRSCRSTDR
jgi:hypothetical protein